VLRDRSAPEVTRAREFLVVARRYEEIVACHQVDFDRAFAEFAAHWEAHRQIRSQGDIATTRPFRTTFGRAADPYVRRVLSRR